MEFILAPGEYIRKHNNYMILDQVTGEGIECVKEEMKLSGRGFTS